MIQILLQIGADCLSLQERHQKLLGNFVEVHPANTSNVDEVVKKKKWLDVWLKQGGRIKMRSPPKVLTGNFRPSQLSFFLS